MIPYEVIHHFLKDIEDGRGDGCGMLGVFHCNLENPGMRSYFKMKPGQTGLLVYALRLNQEIVFISK